MDSAGEMNTSEEWREWAKKNRELKQRMKTATAKAFEVYAIASSAFVCEICGEGGIPTQLYGGYKVTLCNTHNNEWHDFISWHEVWQRVIETDAAYQAAAYSGNERGAIRWALLLDAIRQDCYELSGTWLKEAKMKWTEQSQQ